MEINSKFDPIKLPDSPGKIEPEEEADTASRPPPATGFRELVEPEKPLSAADDLREKLFGVIHAKNLQDPQARLDTGRQVVVETLKSIFEEPLLSEVDLDRMVSTMHEFILNDPSLKEMFDNLLDEFAEANQ